VCGDINKLISYINNGSQKGLTKFPLEKRILEVFASQRDSRLVEIVKDSLDKYSKLIKLSLYEYVRLAENNFLTYENDIPQLPPSIKENIDDVENTDIFNLRYRNKN
jgi:hypothetical protein